MPSSIKNLMSSLNTSNYDMFSTQNNRREPIITIPPNFNISNPQCQNYHLYSNKQRSHFNHQNGRNYRKNHYENHPYNRNFNQSSKVYSNSSSQHSNRNTSQQNYNHQIY